MSTWIRHGLVALVGVLLAATSIWGSAGPASAGGPTSVIMVNPGTGQAAALHTDDARYRELVDAVAAYHTPVGETTPPAAVAGCEPCEIRLTWLIHDVHVWRIDRVHVTADDGIWLASVSDEYGATDLGERQPIWQRPHDPEALAVLLRDLGLTGPVGDSAGNDSAGDGSAGDGSAGNGSAGDEMTTAGSGVTHPVGIALGAGAAGLLAGLAVGWFAHRRHTRGDGPPSGGTQPQDPQQERVILSG